MFVVAGATIAHSKGRSVGLGLAIGFAAGLGGILLGVFGLAIGVGGLLVFAILPGTPQPSRY